MEKCKECQIESAMFVAAKKIKNLCIIIDYNKFKMNYQ